MRQITIVIFAVILFFLSSCMPYDSKKYVEEILQYVIFKVKHRVIS